MADKGHRVPKPPLAKTPPAPTTSNNFEPNDQTTMEKLRKFVYDKEKGEYFYRTCRSWLLISTYSIAYSMFLCTFFLVLLYISLLILKATVDFNKFDYNKVHLLSYPRYDIGLTTAPTFETDVPVIWYKNGANDDYDKYIEAIDKFLSSNRRKRELSSLGPCGQYPYGYGENPCVIVRINKQFNWAGKPLHFNSTIAKSAPAEVQTWMRADRTKLWLQCSGYHSYDKEHIGRIKYYPDPPGFDASMFPLDASKKSPLVAIQISEFTIGVSLAIECKLWYDIGPSTIDFMLYVAPGEQLYNSVNR